MAEELIRFELQREKFDRIKSYRNHVRYRTEQSSIISNKRPKSNNFSDDRSNVYQISEKMRKLAIGNFLQFVGHLILIVFTIILGRFNILVSITVATLYLIDYIYNLNFFSEIQKYALKKGENPKYLVVRLSAFKICSLISRLFVAFSLSLVIFLEGVTLASLRLLLLIFITGSVSFGSMISQVKKFEIFEENRGNLENIAYFNMLAATAYFYSFPVEIGEQTYPLVIVIGIMKIVLPLVSAFMFLRVNDKIPIYHGYTTSRTVSRLERYIANSRIKEERESLNGPIEPILASIITENANCMICKQTLTGQDYSITINCKHCYTLFHRKHLVDWITVKNSCPICKKNLRTIDL
ncbi:MAG: hypothetical protein ACXAC2_15610 [Candidatus Kariarchaeaceae archaeon]